MISFAVRSICLIPNAGNVTCKAGNSCGYSNAKNLAISFGCKEDGTDLTEETHFIIQPNPFSGSTTFIIPDDVELKNAELIIYDVIGREIRRIKNLADHSILIDGENMYPGIYELHLTSDHTILFSGKLVLTK
jgi:hypothetical protein